MLHSGGKPLLTKRRNVYLGSINSCLVNLWAAAKRATGVNQPAGALPVALLTC